MPISDPEMHSLQARSRAHSDSYVALYEMALEEFFTNNPQLKNACLEATKKVEADKKRINARRPNL